MRASVIDRSSLGALAAIALALGGAGCGSARLPLQEASRAFTPADYGGVYDRWTRAADDFHFGRLAEVLHVTATFESWEFRWAYVARYAAEHSFTTEERLRLLEESLADSRDRHRFFVTLAGPIWREGDLTGAQSDWRVLLVDSTGRQVEPVELTRIARPSADQRTYFPSVNRQRHTYRIAFPVHLPDGTPAISDGADSVTLRFAGANGLVDLVWPLEHAPAAPP